MCVFGGNRVPHNSVFYSMKKDGRADHYRQRAAECLRLAELTNDEDLREQYIYLAKCYSEVAEAEAASQANNKK